MTPPGGQITCLIYFMNVKMNLYENLVKGVDFLSELMLNHVPKYPKIVCADSDLSQTPFVPIKNRPLVYFNDFCQYVWASGVIEFLLSLL